MQVRTVPAFLLVTDRIPEDRSRPAGRAQSSGSAAGRWRARGWAPASAHADGVEPCLREQAVPGRCRMHAVGGPHLGSCVHGGRGKEAVDASQMGKLAAQGIHQSLTGNAVRFAGSP